MLGMTAMSPQCPVDAAEGCHPFVYILCGNVVLVLAIVLVGASDDVVSCAIQRAGHAAEQHTWYTLRRGDTLPGTPALASIVIDDEQCILEGKPRTTWKRLKRTNHVHNVRPDGRAQIRCVVFGAQPP